MIAYFALKGCSRYRLCQLCPFYEAIACSYAATGRGASQLQSAHPQMRVLYARLPASEDADSAGGTRIGDCPGQVYNDH